MRDTAELGEYLTQQFIYWNKNIIQFNEVLN